MPTNPLQHSAVERSAAAKSYPDLPATPLIGLRRSGAGRIWLKHEGYSAGGSFFDRVAPHALAAAARDDVGVVGADAFAYSVAVRGASAGVNITVFDVRPNERRLRSLMRHAGARVRAFATEQERSEALSTFTGCVVKRQQTAPIRAALADLAAETRAELRGQDVHWVLPDFSQSPSTLSSALATPMSRITTVADDGERRRELARSACARRQQVAHREGILLSPLGAELVEAAVGVVDESDAAVVVLIPECGRRFVGWW